MGGASRGCPVIWCDLLQPGLTARLYIIAQGLVQLSSECLQEWRLKHISGKALEQDFLHPHREEGFFLISGCSFPCCNFYPLQLLSPATCSLAVCLKGRMWLCLLCNMVVGSRRLQLPPNFISRVNKPSSLNLSLCVPAM